MNANTYLKKPNRFTREIHERGGLGLEYITAAGRTGILWLIKPAVDDHLGPQVTVLGHYVQYLACENPNEPLSML